ncbi:MAG: AAA family ATPase [Myxococcota bacterium]
MPAWTLERVHIENYRSILRSTIELSDVTVLVGRNAAGKSNILDAIQFMGDAIRQGLPAALDGRTRLGRLSFGASIASVPGGIPQELRLEAVLSRSGEPGPPGPQQVSYGFALAPERSFAVVEEWMAEDGKIASLIRGGRWVKGLASTQALPTDRLVLPSLSTAAPFDQLNHIRTLAPNPELIRPPQENTPEVVLNRQGTNLYPCWGRLQADHKELAERVALLFGQIVPNAARIQHKSMGAYSGITVGIKSSPGMSSPQDGARLSDGSLRALALLVGLYQPVPRLVTAIEEPENYIHPFAVERLLDALVGAPDRGQLLLTTQSPTVLDAAAIRTEMLRVVEFRDGHTQVGTLAEAVANDLRSHLVTGGELLGEEFLAMEPTSPSQSLRPDVS